MIKKRSVSEASYRILSDYLTSLFEMPYTGFYDHLRERLVSCDCDVSEHLIRELEPVKKCWFVVTGMVLVYYSDFKKGMVVYQLFKAGEVAILHDEFVNGQPARSGMIVVKGSELLEITAAQMKGIRRLFPKSLNLQNRIVCSHWAKVRWREELMRMAVRDKIRVFYDCYPDVKGKARRVKLLDKDVASFLGMTEYTFSRVVKEMYGEEG